MISATPPPRSQRRGNPKDERIGRPKKPPEEKASARIQLVCTEAERKALRAAAVRANKTLTRFILDHALKHATPKPRRKT